MALTRHSNKIKIHLKKVNLKHGLNKAVVENKDLIKHGLNNRAVHKAVFENT